MSFLEKKEEGSLYNIVTNVVLPQVYHERLLKCEEFGEDLKTHGTVDGFPAQNNHE